MALLAGSACAKVHPLPVQPSNTPTASQAPESPPATGIAAPGSLLVVDPGVVEGLDVRVEEHLEEGAFTYVALPVVPGLAEWTDQMAAGHTEQIQQFRADSTEGDVDRELMVNWELVAASPEVIGFRLSSTETGGETDGGRSETTWYDLTTRSVRPGRDLVDPAQGPLFFERLRAAALADPEVVEAELQEQLDGEWESFDSIAFTEAGNLWVEFDRRQIADTQEPVGVEVDPTGLLAPFGVAAREAALHPQDPGLLALVSPLASATPSATAADTPSPEASASTPSQATISGAVNCAKKKCVALTFDDGPVAGTTKLLDILKKKGVKATFFTMGMHVQSHPEIIKRMVAEGHVVGNHSFRHPKLTRLSAAAIRKELTSTSALIKKAGGVTPTLVRPPYGATNATVKRVAKELGLAQILWNVDPEDWKDRNSATVTKRVLAAARPGSIILSHDIHPTTVAAYAKIIDGLRAKGYVLVTVPQLFGGKLTPGAAYFRR